MDENEGTTACCDDNVKQEVPVDPWAHRAAGMRCKSCMWFVEKVPNNTIGRCRRHAPTMNGYPVVFIHDWCGDHKLNEV